MSEIRIAHEVTEDDVLKRAGSRRMAFYGANTMWWTSNEADFYKKPGGTGLPCDPRAGCSSKPARAISRNFWTQRRRTWSTTASTACARSMHRPRRHHDRGRENNMLHQLG